MGIEKDDIQQSEVFPGQLNFDDVFGTNYGFDKEVHIVKEENQKETQSDYETFIGMVKKSQFTSGFEERKGVVQVNEMGDYFDVNTKEIVLVQNDGLRAVAMFCESDESLLGFILEDICQKIKYKR